MATGESKPEADILHPQLTQHWEHHHTLRDGIWPAHCVVLDDMVALLTWVPGSGDELHISSCDLWSWTTTKLQHGYMSLTTYKSKFVSVGGWIPYARIPINKLFTIDKQMKEQETLPPMPTKRMSPSAVSTTSPEALVVAGGVGLSGSKLDVVEVLQEDQWSTVAPLPQACSQMHSALHDQELYFMGGIDQNDSVYACSCLELISSCVESSNSTTIGRQPWKQFQAPSSDNLALSYLSYLVSIDSKCIIRAYSKERCSWVEVTSSGNMSGVDPVKYTAAAVLPTGELIYAHFEKIYKVKIIDNEQMIILYSEDLSKKLPKNLSFEKMSHESLYSPLNPAFNSVDMGNSCLDAFMSVFADLVEAVKHHVHSVADQCVSVGLISCDSYDIIIQRRDLIDSDKARRLLSCVRDAIIKNEENFGKFISVLKNTSGLDHLIMKLERIKVAF